MSLRIREMPICSSLDFRIDLPLSSFNIRNAVDLTRIFPTGSFPLKSPISPIKLLDQSINAS
jgi:hypothetical protein